MNKELKNFIIDVTAIILSVFFAVWIVRSDIVVKSLEHAGSLKFMGSFVAGMFFTSVFTTVPATAAFIELSRLESPIVMAIFGGLGALFGDLIIFRFVKSRLSSDIQYLLALTNKQRINFIFNKKIFRWMTVFFGALIIASPLPDELGIALLGLTKIKEWHFALISFLLNGFGILIIGLIAGAVLT